MGKSPLKTLLVVLVVVLVAGGVFVVSVRNGLIDREETVKSSWSEIDTQLQRRLDLIPNLVETVKGYAKHEDKIFTEIADARSRLLGATGPAQKAAAGPALESAWGRLLAISENYPDLKANTNFIRLQDELAGTENRISVARTRYNLAAREFNASIRKFPGSLFSNSLGLKSFEYFQPPEGAASVAQPPKVSF